MIKVLSFACPFARVYDVCGQIGGEINAFMHELPSPASAAAACAMHDCGAVEIIDSLCDDEEEEAVETDTFRSTRSVLWNSGSTPCLAVCTVKARSVCIPQFRIVRRRKYELSRLSSLRLSYLSMPRYILPKRSSKPGLSFVRE